MVKACRSRIACDGAPLAKGHFVCADCARRLAKVRVALNDDKERKKAARNPQTGPVCCVMGCYETRVPPDHFCDAHKGEPVE